ncbi:MAG: DinB family protein [Ardenticatenaceae bacterium]|nr:DinB family protein [Ardenticatenaceae bacterium]
MNLKKAIIHLRENSEIIRLLVQEIDDETASYKPDDDSWSILEVINHLYDEEREDFREHLDQILHRPDEPWSRIDPQGWVMERGYNGRSLPDSLANFLRERQRSLDWLEEMGTPNWDTSRATPWRAQITAGDMLASWVAHDLLHMRQLVELKWVTTLPDLLPYHVDYAGGW